MRKNCGTITRWPRFRKPLVRYNCFQCVSMNNISVIMSLDFDWLQVGNPRLYGYHAHPKEYVQYYVPFPSMWMSEPSSKSDRFSDVMIMEGVSGSETNCWYCYSNLFSTSPCWYIWKMWMLRKYIDVYGNTHLFGNLYGPQKEWDGALVLTRWDDLYVLFAYLNSKNEVNYMYYDIYVMTEWWWITARIPIIVCVPLLTMCSPPFSFDTFLWIQATSVLKCSSCWRRIWCWWAINAKMVSLDVK